MKIMMMTALVAMDGLRACGQLVGGLAELGHAAAAIEERDRSRALERRIEILEEEQALEAERARIREAMARLRDLRGPPEPPAVLALLRVDATESFGPGSAEALTQLVYLELVAAGHHPLVPLELGAALAADKVVRPLVLPDGFGCIVGLELQDPVREKREWAGTLRTACDAEALGAAARELARAMP